MFFPVWLALLHALHLPYLVAGAALWCGAALLAALAFSPLWRKTARAGPCADAGAVCGAGVSAVVLGGLHAARLPRQHLPGTLPVLFAGLAGMALRAVFEKDKPLWPWLAAAGAGLACGYLQPRGRRTVPAALCRGGHRHCGGGSGGQAPLESPLPSRSSPTPCSASVC